MQRKQQRSYQSDDGLGKGRNRVEARLDSIYFLILFSFLNYMNILIQKEKCFSLDINPF